MVQPGVGTAGDQHAEAAGDRDLQDRAAGTVSVPSATSCQASTPANIRALRCFTSPGAEAHQRLPTDQRLQGAAGCRPAGNPLGDKQRQPVGAAEHRKGFGQRAEITSSSRAGARAGARRRERWR